MKKFLTVFVTALLCFALVACGAEKNTEYEYIITLLDSGEYDMAIQVIENMKERDARTLQTEAAPVSSEPDPVPTQAPAEPEPTPAQSSSVTPESDGPVALVCNTVSGFMAEKGDAMVKRFEEDMGTAAREVTVTHAMEYRLGNCDGNGSTSHLLLIWLSADIAGDGWNSDNLQLLLDMDTGMVYHSGEIDWDLINACGGMPTNEETFNILALTAYASYLHGNNEFLWSEMEVREELTEADLAAINQALILNLS